MKHLRPSLDEQLRILGEAFVSGEVQGESNDQIAMAILKLILQWERFRHQVVAGTPAASDIDKQTIDKMKTWDSSDPGMSILEKVFRRLAEGRGQDAVDFLKRAIVYKANAFSNEQSRKAKLPRAQHPISGLINQIVETRPDISAKELVRSLRGHLGRGVILDMDDDHIYPMDEAFEAIAISGIKDRLTRAKAKIAKAG